MLYVSDTWYFHGGNTIAVSKTLFDLYLRAASSISLTWSGERNNHNSAATDVIY